MITRALERYIRISPKKLRPVTDLIRMKKADEAIAILVNTNKKGAVLLRSVVESAVNNARRLPEKDFAEEDLFISKILVNMGPVLKRYRAMSMGRAGLIRKRTSHVLVELDAPRKAEPTKSKGKVKKKEKIKKNLGAKRK